MSDVVLYEVSERIATITLNRPEARNALSSEVLRQLPERMRESGREQRRLRAAQITERELDLAVQVRQLDVVAVQDSERADAGCREVERRR